MLNDLLDVLVRTIEAGGALVIFTGAVVAFARFGLGRFLALGLEFQLAGDVLKTAIAPSFHEIGQLAAVAQLARSR